MCKEDRAYEILQHPPFAIMHVYVLQEGWTVPALEFKRAHEFFFCTNTHVHTSANTHCTSMHTHIYTRKLSHARTHTHTYIYIYIYIYVQMRELVKLAEQREAAAKGDIAKLLESRASM